MSSITLEAIEARQTELNQLIAQFKADAANQRTILVIHEAAIGLDPGEHYAGTILDESGQVVHHLVLMAQRPDTKLKWQKAMDWAASVGGAGIHAVRSVLEDYAAMLETLSARTMTECHRLTERRGHEILRGVRQPHDVVVTAI